MLTTLSLFIVRKFRWAIFHTRTAAFEDVKAGNRKLAEDRPDQFWGQRGVLRSDSWHESCDACDIMIWVKL